MLSLGEEDVAIAEALFDQTYILSSYNAKEWVQSEKNIIKEISNEQIKYLLFKNIKTS